MSLLHRAKCPLVQLRGMFLVGIRDGRENWGISWLLVLWELLLRLLISS